MIMNPNAKLAAILVMALGTIGTTATAFAQTDEEEETEETELAGDAIERGDRAVHEIFGPGGEEDIEFHQALCEAGITTEALEELGGCEILPPLVPEIDD
jgi:hypothetical protein